MIYRFRMMLKPVWIFIIMFIDRSKQDRMMFDFTSDELLRTHIQDIVESTKTSDVIVLTQDQRQDHNTVRVLSAISEKLSTIVPTRYISAAKISESRIEVTPLATSASLVIYMYATQSKLRSDTWEQILNGTWAVSHSSHTPKILLLLVHDEADSEIPDFLQYLWTKKVLHVVVLEILSSKSPNEKFTIIAHQYNPFAENYTKIIDPERVIDWYPEKLKNMYQRPLAVHAPTLDVTMATYITADVEMLRFTFLAFLRDAMNFTLMLTTDKAQTDMFLNDYGYLYQLDGSIDTLDVLMDSEVCLVTPILPIKTITLWNFVGMICFGVGIVVLFLAVSTLLAVNRRLRHPMYLMNLLFGFSVTRSPTTLTEKVLFLCLVGASVRYTSMFYTELFNLAVVNQEIEINDFDDLAKSDLPVAIDRDLYLQIANSSDIPAVVRQKMHPVESMFVLYKLITATSFLNTSYFLDPHCKELLASGKHIEGGQRILKQTDVCIRFQNIFYVVPKRSPYKERFTELLWRMASMGYVDLTRRNVSSLVTIGLFNLNNGTPVTKPGFTIPLPFVALFFGYCLSLFVFVGEIVVHRLRRVP